MEAYQRLEMAWAEFSGLDPEGMVVCSSGTAALHLALEAFRLPAGSEVIVPDLSMIACPRAVVLAGLTPVLVDCGEDLNLDQGLVKQWYEGRSIIAEGGGFGDIVSRGQFLTAILAVHTYGRRCNMEGLAEAAGESWWKDTFLVEDLAEAHGLRPHSRTDAACWSFYQNKIVAGEEGGAVWFKDVEHARRARSLRCLGFTEAHDFNHIPRGHNYRLSNANAEAILYGRNGLGNYGLNLKERRDIEGWYEEACPREWRMPRRQAPWVYDLRIPGMGPVSQDKVVTVLRGHGIAARHCFKPVHTQEEFCRCRFVYGESRHKSSLLSSSIIYLPIQPGQTTRQDCGRAMALLRGLVESA